MRVVIDTNVLVSTVLGSGTPHHVYSRWRDQLFEVVISWPLFSELGGVLERGHIRGHPGWSSSRAEEVLGNLRDNAMWVDPDQQITRITTDPDDNRVLEAAVEGATNYIVSGDRDLLDLVEHDGISIVTPAQFLAILALEASEQ